MELHQPHEVNSAITLFYRHCAMGRLLLSLCSAGSMSCATLKFIVIVRLGRTIYLTLDHLIKSDDDDQASYEMMASF